MTESEKRKWNRSAREGYVDRMDKHYWTLTIRQIKEAKKELTVLIVVSAIISFIMCILVNYPFSKAFSRSPSI